MHQLISKKTAMVILNLGMLVCFWTSGAVEGTASSIAAAVSAVLIMNAVAWRSGKEFPDWK
jgi:hypothetical protein